MSAEAMPAIVRSLCFNFDAWIVNSGRDWDVIVPPEQWNKAALSICKENIAPNSFGGWKITSENTTIDVWPNTIEEYIKITPVTYPCSLYQPKTRMIIIRSFKAK